MDSGSNEERGFLSDDSWAGDRNGRDVYAARPKPQWAFLTKWFKRVARRCSISDAERANSHPVRIGREMDDLWIDVRVDDGSTTGYIGRTKPVDYKSWIGGMVRKAYFPVPEYLELQHCPEIAREFCFFLNSYLAPLYYQWDVLQHLMGDEDFSDEFVQDMSKITDATRATGRDVDLFVEIPIKLALEPEGTDGEDLERELEILRGVTQSVRELLVINERNRRAAGAVRTRPWFRFDSIDLDLPAFAMHPEVFNGIRELLETGIRVKTLTLPRRTSQEDVDQKTLTRAWIELVVTSLGHRVLDSGHAAQLDRLEVPNHYMTEQSMAPLCSALRETKVLKQLALDFNVFHELESASQRRLWKWIDFALFNPTPLNSVDTLELGFIKPLATVHSRLVSSEESLDPVGDLWKAESGASDRLDLDVSDRAIVQIAIDTTLSEVHQHELEAAFA